MRAPGGPPPRSLAASAVRTRTILGDPATCPEMLWTTFQSLKVGSRDDTVSRSVTNISMAAVVAPLQAGRIVPKAQKGKGSTPVCFEEQPAFVGGAPTGQQSPWETCFATLLPRDDSVRHARGTWPGPQAHATQLREVKDRLYFVRSHTWSVVALCLPLGDNSVLFQDSGSVVCVLLTTFKAHSETTKPPTAAACRLRNRMRRSVARLALTTPEVGRIVLVLPLLRKRPAQTG